MKMKMVKRGRPEKAIRICKERSAEGRAQRINDLHERAMVLAQGSVTCAIVAGLELLAQKAELAHGEFEGWVEKNCTFARCTAFRYVALARRVTERFKLKLADEFLAGEMNPAVRVKFVEQVARAVDGETLKGLYEDFGIVKPRVEAGKFVAPEPVGLPEGETVEHFTAMEWWSERLVELNEEMAQRNYFGFLKPTELRSIAQQLRAAALELDSLATRG